MFTVKEAAKYACVSEALLRGWLREGLPHYRLGAKGRRGHIKIAREDFDAWLASFKVARPDPKPARVSGPPPSAFTHLRLS